MMPIRRLALSALIALFITLGTTAPISSANNPVHPERCAWEPESCELL